MTLKQLKYRIPLIFVQFICSAFVAYCLYKTGPHWILTCLLVPPFRLYLMLHLSKQERQSSPNESYRNIIRSRNWHQVEVTICLTMAVVFFGFSILLLYGFLKLMANACYLLAGFASISASLLYVINSLIIVGSLRQGTIMDIEVNKKPLKQLSYAEVKNSNPLSETAKSGQEMLMLRDKLMKRPEESNELYELSNQSNNNKIITNYRISELMGYETLQLNRIFASENSQIKPTILTDQQQEANQQIISSICEEMDQNLNNRISCDNDCSNNKESKNCNINNNDNYCYNNNYNHNCNSGNSNINNRINNNSNNNKKNNESNNNNSNNNNNNNDNDVTTVDSKARYRYPSAEYLNIPNSDRLCNQKPLQQRHAGNLNQNSKRKLRQIPLIVKTAGMANDQSWRLNCSCRIEHYSDQIRAMCENHKFDNRFNNKRLISGCSELKIYESNGQGDRLVDLLNPRQYQHFASMIDEQGGTVVHGKKYLRKERSNCKSNSYDILSNEYNNLFDNRPKCLPKAVSAPISHNDKNNSHGRIINEMKPSSSNVQEKSHVVAHTFGDHQRNNNNNNNNREQRRYYSRHSYSREPSKIIQHRSYTYARSDDEGLESHNDNDITVRNTCTTEENSLWKHGSVIGPSCIPSIVAFIDSGRESEINRNNFPKRTSSMDKKMRNKGLEVMMTRARSEEYLRKRRRTRSISSSSYEKPTDEYFVTEF